MYKIGWFSTGRDEAARQLLSTAYDAIHSGDIAAEIDFVFSSRAPGENPESDRFLELVKGYGIPLFCLSYQQFKDKHPADARGFPAWRLEYDRAIMNLLHDRAPDLCVLAGYMLIVGPEMCQKFNMVNLHPAAPGGPTGTWQEVIWKLIDERAAETGAMMHLVTPELDRGPVVTYCTFPIMGKPFDLYWKSIGTGQEPDKEKARELFCLIREHGLKREFPLILSTIRAFSEGKVKIENGQVFDCRGQPIAGYDLSREIDKITA